MLHTAYNPYLVALSVLIASLASYVALDMAGRVTAASGAERKYWILASAGAMGIGIWSMHFIGMLALIVSTPVAYDVPLLAASIAIAIAGSAVTFFMSAREQLRTAELALASLFMGPAIAGMHYTGMAAMRMKAHIVYDPGLLLFSILIAIVVSFVAIQFAMRLRHDDSPRGKLLRAACGALMGAAVYGMHYTGMLAARFEHTPAAMESGGWSVLGNSSLALAVSLTTLMILAIAAQGTFADRRMRARTAEANNRTTDLLRAVIEDSPEAIVATDLDLRVTRWNAAATALLGWQAREMVGDFFSRVLPVEGREQDAEVRQSARLGGRSRQAEASYLHKDGSQVDVRVSLAPLRNERDEPSGFVYLVTDETKRKRQEAEVRQSQKMEAVGQLAGGVAHDFNNLLTVIISYAAFVLKGLGENHPQRTDVLEIRKAADRAAALTTQLLAFSRQQMIQQAELSFNVVINEMQPMLKRLLPANIRIIPLLDESLGLVWADPGQMGQVLLNIVLNARDAMPDGGTLTIRTANIPAGEADDVTGREIPGEAVALIVTDTGLGMTPEVQAHAFEPFFTTKSSGKGTGLGLATVYGIVAQSEGCLALHSEPGKGTRFTVSLPRVEGASAQHASAGSPSQTSDEGSETILLIDDDEMVRTVTSRSLREMGYTVLEAGDGYEAMASHATYGGTIDLVITDMVMPGMGGEDVDRFLEETSPGTRILFISGYSPYALANQRTNVATRNFLAKPFTSELLARKVREILDSA